MFELSPSPAIASPFLPIAAPSSGASGDFAQALAALVSPHDTDSPVIPVAGSTPVAPPFQIGLPTVLPIGRQTLADIGKTLPASPLVAGPPSPGVLTPLVATADPALTLVGDDAVPLADGDLPAPSARTASQPKAARFTARSETLPIDQQIVKPASALGETSRAKRSAGDPTTDAQDNRGEPAPSPVLSSITPDREATIATAALSGSPGRSPVLGGIPSAKRDEADQANDAPVDERAAASLLVFSLPSPNPLPATAASAITPERESTILPAAPSATPARSSVPGGIPAARHNAADPVTDAQADQSVATSLPLFAAPSPTPLPVPVTSATTPDPESAILATTPGASLARPPVTVALLNPVAAPEPFVSQGVGSSQAPSFELLTAPALPSSVTSNGQRASALAPASKPISFQPDIQPEPTARLIPPSPSPLPTPLIGLVVPAARAFAAGIAASSVRPLRARSDDGAPAPLGAPAPAAVFPSAPAAQTDTQSAPIDMRREDWAQALIDRIDASQDVANARDTRIRLVPDALGKIDVALHRQGDTLHVHFTADVPATRALLVEAQPSLAALADARGLRLGDASVDGSALASSQGQNQGQSLGQGADQRRAQPAPAAPPSATRNNSADELAASDHRIA
ncbi:MAG: hypothetical protein BVN33_04245 [Proteobacteria bacterium ST_bin13]|nr:MAG: hypothetical protein BVN33_04245 [Proteobacteria bacterium ST_bin13]